jgi:hypothetical protein
MLTSRLGCVPSSYNRLDHSIISTSRVFVKMSKRQASDIWKHFIKVTDNVNKAKCTYCGSEISRGGQNAAAKGLTPATCGHMSSDSMQMKS